MLNGAAERGETLGKRDTFEAHMEYFLQMPYSISNLCYKSNLFVRTANVTSVSRSRNLVHATPKRLSTQNLSCPRISKLPAANEQPSSLCRLQFSFNM